MCIIIKTEKQVSGTLLQIYKRVLKPRVIHPAQDTRLPHGVATSSNSEFVASSVGAGAQS